MRVFVTVGTEYIASAVVPEILQARHQVVRLARSGARPLHLEPPRAGVYRSALDDLDIQRHEPPLRRTGAAAAASAVKALGAALEDSGALAILGRVVTEVDVSEPSFWRVALENTAIALTERGVRSSVVRLPPTTRDGDGDGDGDIFVLAPIGIVQDNGASAFVGDGSNR
jgi:uncharacterized protein YbjT (DUF2867 family)